MPETSVKLTPITVALNDLLLDPNNPRFATSLNLQAAVPDEDVSAEQQRVRDLFVTSDRASDSSSQDDDSDVNEGPVEIGDLITKMDQIGFVPIDQIVVRKLQCKSERQQFVVIEGNRRVSAAKYLLERKPSANPETKKHNDWVADTVRELDVLLLNTEGLSEAEVHHQIGVILGLRHFGSVLGWGPLAKAVNIFNEYMATEPAQTTFALDPKRLTLVEKLLSVPRAHVRSALATYIAYRQLQEAFPQAPPRPKHYSLIQACVNNRKLIVSGFVEQDKTTYELTAPSVEAINGACEFQTRDDPKAPGEPPNILIEDKSVIAFAGLIGDAASNPDNAVRAFAASLRDEVLHKDRTLADAVNNLKTFKSDRVWTEALSKLLDKAEKELDLKDFRPMGNDLLKLEEAQKAFKNVRKILSV
jgi:hypothetical protein